MKHRVEGQQRRGAATLLLTVLAVTASSLVTLAAPATASTWASQCPGTQWAHVFLGPSDDEVADDTAPSPDEYWQANHETLRPEDMASSVVRMPAGEILRNDRTSGDALLVTAPAHAKSFELFPNGGWAYWSQDGNFAADSFQYLVRSSGGYCSRAATVTIPAAEAPRVRDDVFATTENTAFDPPLWVCGRRCGVLENDSNEPNVVTRLATDTEAIPWGFREERDAVTIPTSQGGSVTMHTGGTFTYTPPPDWTGEDSFYYSARRERSIQVPLGLGKHESSQGELYAKVTMKVLPPPDLTVVASDDTGPTVEEDGSVTIQASDLLANDNTNAALVSADTFPILRNPQGGCLQAGSTGYPCPDLDPSGRSQHGTIEPVWDVYSPGGTLVYSTVKAIRYTPDPNYSGPDSFTYMAVDQAAEYGDGAHRSQPATVSLSVSPSADAPTAVPDTIPTGRGETVTVDVLANDSDPDGDLTSPQEPVLCPAGGCDTHGTWSTGPGTLTYTPADNYTGSFDTSYQITDDAGQTDVTEVHVEVTSNTARPDSYQVDEDRALTVAAGTGVLSNDQPVPGTAVEATVAEGPAHGSLTLAENGSFDYQPEADYHGADSFTYTTDGSTATVDIDVVSIPDAPEVSLNVACGPETVQDGTCTEDGDVRVVDSGGTIELRGWVADGDYAPGELSIRWGDEGPLDIPQPLPYGGTDSELTPNPLWEGACQDGCTPEPLYFSQTHSYDAPGEYTIKVVATDGTDLSGSATTTATVRDTSPPVIAGHDDLGPVEATGPDGATVDYAPPATTDDGDGTGTATCTPASGQTFPLGTSQVTCTATDDAGNSATATTFAVTVTDSTAPTISHHLDLHAAARTPRSVTYEPPATQDTVDGVGTAACTPASGSTFPAGRTTVTCTATDAAGNESEPTNFDVIVLIDGTPPEIADHPDMTESAGPGGTTQVDYTPPTTEDAVDGDGTATCFPAPGSDFPLGETTVTCSAQDALGNAASSAFTVTVIDDTTPGIDVRSPADEAVLVAGQRTRVAYRCSDEVEVVRCAGSLRPGERLRTRRVGSFSFGVTAVDSSGNDTAVEHHYAVAYGVRRLEQSGPRPRAGQVLTVRLRLKGAVRPTVTDRVGRRLDRANAINVRLERPGSHAVGKPCSYDRRSNWFECEIKTRRGMDSGRHKGYSLVVRQSLDNGEVVDSPVLSRVPDKATKVWLRPARRR